MPAMLDISRFSRTAIPIKMEKIFWLFIFSLIVSNLAFAAKITTRREERELEDLSTDQHLHSFMSEHHKIKASEYGVKKDEWQVRKDNAHNPLFKSHCNSQVRFCGQRQEEHTQFGRELENKANKFSEEIKTRQDDHQAHLQLIERVKERAPKANSRHRRTRSNN